MQKKLIDYFWSFIYLFMILCVTLSIFYRNSSSTIPGYLIFGALIPFLLLWGKYFYRVFKIERSSVTKTTIGPLPQELINDRNAVLKQNQNAGKNLLYSFIIMTCPILVGILISNSSLSDINNDVSTFLFFLNLTLLIIGLVCFVFYAQKYDKVLKANKDLKDGLIRIEGKAYITNLSIKNRNLNTQYNELLLRMGKYAFNIDEEKVKNIIEGDVYAIIFPAGSNQILSIEKVNLNTNINNQSSQI